MTDASPQTAVPAINIQEGGVHLVLAITGDQPVRLLHVGAGSHDPATVPADQQWAYRLVELVVAGEDHDYISAGRYAGSGIGGRLRYHSHHEERTELGLRLIIVQRDETGRMEVVSSLLIEDSTIESATRIINTGTAPIVLQSVSSFFLVGLTKEGTLPRGLRAAIHTPRNGWYAEFQWTRALASDLGLNNRFAFGSRHETVRSVGTWCSSNHLPMGYVENVETGGGLLWEILHSGSWSWQVGETAGELYLHLAGPTEAESAWWRTLAPGESFDSVPVVVVPTSAGLDDAMAALVRHRRRSKKVAPDGAPVVFNDYMNCLMGDPTEAKVLPLIDSAARLGAEVYCMDAGWYAEPGVRWSSLLGWWTADPVRFPNGLGKVMERIRERGMVAGLWFEIEAMTGNHPLFAELPDEWFFVRHGERVLSHRRHQLDFRQEAVRAFADDAIDRAVGELGCRYLKLDYNFNSGPGSDLGAESPGQALLDYDAALLGWFDELSARYPELMIEHCASGGMRLGRPFLDRTHNASNSDEGDPLQIARIACAATSILLPEQNGTWALPKAGEDKEATAFAMLCAIPYRMLLAGGAGDLPDSQRRLVAEAVQLHKAIRADIRSATPCWPLGLPGYHDAWICAGLRTRAKLYIVLWRRRAGPDECEIPLPADIDIRTGRILYPAAFETRWSVAAGSLSVALPPLSARMWSFEVASL